MANKEYTIMKRYKAPYRGPKTERDTERYFHVDRETALELVKAAGFKNLRIGRGWHCIWSGEENGLKVSCFICI